jgi:Zn-dependent oligopeptidase
MHGLCSEGTGNSTRLAKCPRDFVEAPSQMLENWCWQKTVLERLSKHYQTGKPLPDGLLQSMIKAKHVCVAFSSLRQIYLARLDLTIHGPDPPTDSAGLQAIVDELRPKIALVDNPNGNNILRTFGHLMKQYSASYVRKNVHAVLLGETLFLTLFCFLQYGYMWAEVLSADMFATRFDAEGVMNPKVGMEYRKMVLAPGGTHNIADHLTKFLGRPPSNEAFLKSRGILKD